MAALCNNVKLFSVFYGFPALFDKYDGLEFKKTHVSHFFGLNGRAKNVYSLIFTAKTRFRACDAKISPLGPRDLFSEGRQIYQLLLNYQFSVSKGGQVRNCSWSSC